LWAALPSFTRFDDGIGDASKGSVQECVPRAEEVEVSRTFPAPALYPLSRALPQGRIIEKMLRYRRV
jgi:hypothetical protein